MKAIIIRSAIALMFLSIAACGNKGDLFLVEKPPVESTSKTAVEATSKTTEELRVEELKKAEEK